VFEINKERYNDLLELYDNKIEKVDMLLNKWFDLIVSRVKMHKLTRGTEPFLAISVHSRLKGNELEEAKKEQINSKNKKIVNMKEKEMGKVRSSLEMKNYVEDFERDKSLKTEMKDETNKVDREYESKISEIDTQETDVNNRPQIDKLADPERKTVITNYFIDMGDFDNTEINYIKDKNDIGKVVCKVIRDYFKIKRPDELNRRTLNDYISGDFENDYNICSESMHFKKYDMYCRPFDFKAYYKK